MSLPLNSSVLFINLTALLNFPKIFLNQIRYPNYLHNQQKGVKALLLISTCNIEGLTNSRYNS